MNTVRTVWIWLLSMKWELFWLAAGIVIVFFLPHLLQAVDDTAAAPDSGILAFPVISAIGTIVFGLGLFFFVKRLAFPKVFDDWFDGEGDISWAADFRSVGPANRLWLSMALLAIVVIGLAISLSIIKPG